MPKIFDKYGTQQSWAWLQEYYGALVIHPATAGPGWRCVELHENADIATGVKKGPFLGHIGAAAIIMVHVQDDTGSPAANVQVAWYWPDAPENPEAGPANGVPSAMRPGHADNPGTTDGNGNVGFGMGGGAYYFPPNQGPHATWIYGTGTNSDVVLGLGMRGGTNHDSLWPVFQWSDEGEPEEPQPPAPGNGIAAELLAIQQAIGRIRAAL
jgi:hypothetical protein